MVFCNDIRCPLVCLLGSNGCAPLVNILEDCTLDLEVLEGSLELLFVLLSVHDLAQERVAAAI